MRFLADESCDFAVVHALRANGHDMLAVSEVTPRAEDFEVIRLAVREKRILLTGNNGTGSQILLISLFGTGSQILLKNQIDTN